MTEHSKGPWTWSWDNGRIFIDSEETGQVARLDPGLTSDRERANAKLICQAPDMFEVLSDLLDNCPPGWEVSERARAILEKVTGD